MVQNYRYLIIGGAPKSGTTSLYIWFAGHPAVCASSLKETRFFLDLSSDLPSADRFTGSNLQDYEAYFRNCTPDLSSVRIEASPDYLYSLTAVKIAHLLPQSRIVFILRDPVERMVSWYKFALQKDLIDQSMGFEDYVNAQIGLTVLPDTPIHLQALSQCCYENYLPAFRAAFGSRCLEIDFNDLKDNPDTVVAKICALIGLDDDYFAGFEFRKENASRVHHSARAVRLYNVIRRNVAQALRGNPRVANLLRTPNRVVKNLLTRSDTAPAPTHVSKEVAERIVREVDRN